MIVVATWPLLLRLQSLLGGRRGLAVTVMTVVLLLILVVPLYLGIAALISGTEEIAARLTSLTDLELPAPPDWVKGIPVIGQRLGARWQEIVDTDRAQLAEQVAPQVRQMLAWVIARDGGLGLMLVQFLLTLIIAAALYANGETAADGARCFARWLAGERGETLVNLAGQAVRSPKREHHAQASLPERGGIPVHSRDGVRKRADHPCRPGSERRSDDLQDIRLLRSGRDGPLSVFDDRVEPVEAGDGRPARAARVHL
jgi:hypothetical protein